MTKMKQFIHITASTIFMLLGFCLPMSAFEYVDVTPANSSVSKVDVGGDKVSSITLIVTLKDNEAPNGQAQLRLASDENKLVMGETTQLLDNVLTQKSTNPNVWEITWNNVKAGDYKVYFQQTDGSAHTYLHGIQVVELPEPPAPKLTLTKKDVTCGSPGYVNVELAGGAKPFSYKATITHDRGGSNIRTKENTSDRGWVIDNLADGDRVNVEVTDAKGRKASASINSINSVSPEFWSDGSNYFVKRTGKETFDYYISFKISCDDEKSLQEAVDMLVKTAKIKGEDGEWYSLEYAPAYTYEFWKGYYRYFFKIPFDNGRLDFKDRRYDIKFTQLCEGEKTKNFYFWDTTVKQMLNISPHAAGTPTEGCGWKDTSYSVSYDFAGGDHLGGKRVYFFMDEAHRFAKIYKQKADLTYPSEPLMEVPMWTEQFDIEKDFSFELPGTGVYKMVYSTGNPQTDFEHEFIVSEPKPEMVYYAAPEATKGYRSFQRKSLGIHGNTAGIVFSTINLEAPFQVIVSRSDGKKDFMITDFGDDHEYQKTINFPQTIDFTKSNSHYNIGDLPAGDYVFTLKDKCGRTSDRGIRIEEDNLMTYKLRRDNGYGEGVLVEYSCDNQSNKVNFDFGTTEDKHLFSRSTLQYGYVTQKVKSSTSDGWTYGSDKPSDLKDEVYFGISYYPTITSGASVETLADQEVYSAIAKETRTYTNDVMNIHANNGSASWKPVDQPDPYWAKSYKFVFKESEVNAFDVTGASCDVTAKKGNISVSLQSGKTVTMPATYELYKADANGNPQGSAIQTYTARSTGQANVVWKDLVKGIYAVRITYGSGGSCDVKKVVDLTTAELPQVIVKTPKGYEVKDNIYIDITDGMKPLQVTLPVSNHIYDVEWYDITGDKNELKQKGNNIYVTFTEPGTYTYKIQTMFTDNTSCSGSSGGERLVKFYVTRNEQKNYWMGSTDENNGDNFSVASNWTANKVPAEGEDIVFATEANNNGHAAVNDCRLTGTGRLPLNFTATNLVNESQKAMVIPQGSALYVKTSTVGFEHQKDNNGKYAPVRLKIEAGSNGKANGTFVARYQGVEKDKIYAEVQMNVLTKAVKETWNDNLTGSPTFGKTLYINSTDQFFGIPFAEMSAAQFPKSRLYVYDETHNAEKMFYRKFRNVAKGETMHAFKAYSIRRDEPRTMPLRGYLNYNDVTLKLTREAAMVDGATGEESFVRWGLGQNLFGNSFTAPIKISSITMPDDLEKTVYIYNTGSGKDWTATLSNSDATGAGTYTAVPIDIAAILNMNEIPSMQGFLLKYTKDKTVYSTTPTEVKLSYNNNVMTTASLPQRAKAYEMENNQPTGFVKLVLLGEKAGDQMWLCESENATEGFDNGWDGSKLGGEMMPTAIYSTTKDGIWQVNTTNDITKANITVRVSEPGTYCIKATKKGLEQYENLKLVDCQARIITPFDADTLSYSFATDVKSMNQNRFVLMNTKATMFEDIKTGIDLQSETLTGDFHIYDLTGAFVKDVSLSNERTFRKLGLAPGVYIVVKKDSIDKTGRKLVITD